MHGAAFRATGSEPAAHGARCCTAGKAWALGARCTVHRVASLGAAIGCVAEKEGSEAGARMRYAPRTLVGVPPVVPWVPQQGPSTVLFDGKAEEQAAGIARDGDEDSAYGVYARADAVRGARGRLGPWRTKYARGHWHAVHRGTCTRRILELPWMYVRGYTCPSSHGARSTVRIFGVRVPSGRTAHGPSSKIPQTHAPRCTVHRADATCAEMERAAWTLRGGGFGNLKKKGGHQLEKKKVLSIYYFF